MYWILVISKVLCLALQRMQLQMRNGPSLMEVTEWWDRPLLMSNYNPRAETIKCCNRKKRIKIQGKQKWRRVCVDLERSHEGGRTWAGLGRGRLSPSKEGNKVTSGPACGKRQREGNDKICPGNSKGPVWLEQVSRGGVESNTSRKLW